MQNHKHDGIIILGHPRSGTTLLRRMLDRHSRIACPGETHILSASASFIRSQPTAEGVDMGVLAGLSFAGFNDDEVVSRLREFAFAFPREYAAKQGKPRWAEKTAFDSFVIPEIELLCGDNAYFVGIVRHGLDVAASCIDFVNAAGTYPRAMHPYIQRFEMPLEAFARSWVDVNTALLDFAGRHEGNCVLCRYEDLIEEPIEVLSTILEFVGERLEAPMVAQDFRETDQSGFGDHKSYQRSGVSQESRNRWKAVSPFMLNRLAEVVNPLLEKLGYERVEVSGDLGGKAEARRRYEMSLMIHAGRSRSGER